VWSGHSCPLPLTSLLILTSPPDRRHPERSRSSGGARDLAHIATSINTNVCAIEVAHQYVPPQGWALLTLTHYRLFDFCSPLRCY
jgi:hypothetical protein